MRIQKHIRSNVVGYIAVFLALTTSAAALPGRETVQSNDLKPNAVKAKHIKDGEVRGADVAADSLTGSDIDESSLTIRGGGTPSGPAGGDLTGTYPAPEIAANAVDGSHVANGSLLGADISDATITGADVAANALGGPAINEATLDLPARPVVSPVASCNPTNSAFVRCLTRSIRFVGPNVNQAVVIASLSWFTDGLGGKGECQLRIGSAVMDTAPIGTNDSSTDATHTQETTLIGMPSGSDGSTADVSVHCNETETQISFPRVAMAVLGDVAPAS